MKKILILVAALTVAFFAANAHCYPSYMWSGSVTHVSGSISTTYIGNKNFQTSGSGTTVFNSGTNFNAWKRLNFETKIQVKVPINFPSGGAEVGMYDTVKFDYVNMTDSDIIYAEGKTEIVTLISNNSKPGQWNIIFTYDSIKIGPRYYTPGDTFYSTPGNKETAVIITDCRGTTLAETYIQVKDKLKVVSSTHVVKSLRIYNILGQLVKSVNSYEVSLSELSDLSSGWYFLRVTDESGKVFFTTKFVKD